MVAEDGGGDFIKPNVVAQDLNGFRFRMKNAVGELKKRYADQLKTEVTSILFDGQPINDTETQKTLKMEDKDVIHIHHNMIEAGAKTETSTPNMGVSTANDGDADTIMINVVGPDDMDQIHFRLKTTMVMVKLKKSYADWLEKQVDCLQFLFDGRVFNDTGTAETLGLQENYTIEVFHVKPDVFMPSKGSVTGIVVFGLKLQIQRKPKVDGMAANDGVRTEQSTSNIGHRYIFLRVISKDYNEIYFLLKASTTMGILKKSYANVLGKKVNSFLFVFEDRLINDMDTPISLGLKNNDIIMAYQEQPGGNFNLHQY